MILPARTGCSLRAATLALSNSTSSATPMQTHLATPRILYRNVSSTNGISSATASTKGKSFRKVVFSGIQPTGIPHLGNYLGAIQNWIKLQQTMKSHTEAANAASEAPSKILYSIVGLHAITMPQDPKILKRERREALACLLACGVGPGGNLRSETKRATLFFQEEVPEHAELAWYFNTLTGVGKLQRMTTWKSKLAIAAAEGGNNNVADNAKSEENLRLGLLAYPVLQAADILLYKSTHVPVGEDQQQHLELSRDIADSFNHKFGKVFPLPQHVITPTKRVLSLTDPTQKMSKSAPNPASRILITDTPEQIRKKIRGAVTDNDRTVTFDPVERKGVANLLSILSACQSEDVNVYAPTVLDTEETMHPDVLAAQLTTQGISGHAQLKSIVADAVITKLQSIREEYVRLKEDIVYLREVAAVGREEAGNIAAKTMDEVRKRVGLDRI